jgi:hypothetical protein
MKKLLTICFLVIISFVNVNGQWYVKKYGVKDINDLTRDQLTVSFEESKWSLITSGGIALMGGGVYLISKYGDNSIGEDATFFEQLLGERGKKKLGMAAGFGMLAGGAIGVIVYAGRKGKISSVIRNNYPYSGLIELSPTVILCRSTRAYYPGLALTYNF